ncbi:hypothetical protein O7614_26735 [Micromonospora sp. WMMD961]|uniref:hypothetical protein n=1 Tax=Micromonospora sp. WMMD961 TaxID=3016100 RepID=UPI0024176A91|nr:hypothetical protein [Micromonospora sp. WMMD961]MDG4783262.1 hypothetical protein [Micromonospora sp. WMMD961]
MTEGVDPGHHETREEMHDRLRREDPAKYEAMQAFAGMERVIAAYEAEIQRGDSPEEE